MNPVDTIKRQMYDEEKRRGLRNQVVVDTPALLELLDRLERIDAFARSMSDDHASLQHRLCNVMRALYAENHDSERLMLLIMDILKPMVLARVKESEMDRVYTR